MTHARQGGSSQARRHASILSLQFVFPGAERLSALKAVSIQHPIRLQATIICYAGSGDPPSNLRRRLQESKTFEDSR